MRVVVLCIALVGLLGAGLFTYRAASLFRLQYRDFAPHRVAPAVPPGSMAGRLRSLEFRLDDATRIAAWSLPSRNGVVVVYIHGSPGHRSNFLHHAEVMNQSGYGALLLDMPGHGESGGEANWGGASVAAVRRAVDVAIRLPGARHVALFGYSMGSCIAARVAAGDRRVGALVLLAPFTDLAEHMRYQFRQRVPFVSEFAVLAARVAGVPVNEMRTLDALRASPSRPLLIVAGDRDSAIPVEMPRALYAVAATPKKLWIVEGASHIDARSVAGPAVFDGAIRAFLDDAFLARPVERAVR